MICISGVKSCPISLVFFSISSILATKQVYKISKGGVQPLERYDRVGEDMHDMHFRCEILSDFFSFFFSISSILATKQVYEILKGGVHPLESYDRVGEGMQEMQDMPFRCEILSDFFNFSFQSHLFQLRIMSMKFRKVGFSRWKVMIEWGRMWVQYLI